MPSLATEIINFQILRHDDSQSSTIQVLNLYSFKYEIL